MKVIYRLLLITIASAMQSPVMEAGPVLAPESLTALQPKIEIRNIKLILRVNYFGSQEDCKKMDLVKINWHDLNDSAPEGNEQVVPAIQDKMIVEVPITICIVSGRKDPIDIYVTRCSTPKITVGGVSLKKYRTTEYVSGIFSFEIPDKDLAEGTITLEGKPITKLLPPWTTIDWRDVQQ